MRKRQIEFSGVHFAYDPQLAVFDDLTLTFEAGLTLVVGANGAGKSTLLKLSAGVEKPDIGRVIVNGHDLWHAEVEARSDLAYLPERADLTPYATIGELLTLVSRLRRVSADESTDVLDRVGLTTLRRRTIRELSEGQQRRVLLAAALLGSPRTLLLDEPFNAMDVEIRELIINWIERTCSADGLVVVSSHDAAPLSALAHRVIHVDRGHITVVDPPELDASPRPE